MKLCSDKQCERAGDLLPPEAFAPNGYCRDCARRRMQESRERKREQKRAQAGLPPASSLSATAQVLAAIERGTRTREAIESETRLHEDLISDVLAHLAFDEESIRIVKVGSEKEFHLAA